MDGDIILYDDEEYIDELNYDAVGLPSRLWPKVDDEVKIPYTLPNDVPQFDKTQIDRAIDEFKLKTCIRLFSIIVVYINNQTHKYTLLKKVLV